MKISGLIPLRRSKVMDKKEAIQKVLSKVIPIILSFIPLAIFLIYTANMPKIMVQLWPGARFFIPSYFAKNGFPFFISTIMIPLSTILVELAMIFDGHKVTRVFTFIFSIATLLSSALIILQGIGMMSNEMGSSFEFVFVESSLVTVVAYYPFLYYLFAYLFKNKYLNILTPIIAFGVTFGIGCLISIAGLNYGPFFSYILPVIGVVVVLFIAACIITFARKVKTGNAAVTILFGVNILLMIAPMIVVAIGFIAPYASGTTTVFPLPMVFFGGICIVTAITLMLGGMHYFTLLAGLGLTLTIWIQYLFFGYHNIYPIYMMAMAYACSIIPLLYYILFNLFKGTITVFLSSVLSIGVSFGAGYLIAWMGSHNMGLSIVALLIVAVFTLSSIFIVGRMSGDINNWNFDGKSMSELKDINDWTNYFEEKATASLGYTSSEIRGFSLYNKIELSVKITSLDDEEKYHNIEYVTNATKDKIKKIAKKCPFEVSVTSITVA